MHVKFSAILSCIPGHAPNTTKVSTHRYTVSRSTHFTVALYNSIYAQPRQHDPHHSRLLLFLPTLKFDEIVTHSGMPIRDRLKSRGLESLVNQILSDFDVAVRSSHTDVRSAHPRHSRIRQVGPDEFDRSLEIRLACFRSQGATTFTTHRYMLML